MIRRSIVFGKLSVLPRIQFPHPSSPSTRSASMAVDPRQILAAVLTVTMFVMLGDMIKRDHFTPPTIHNTNRVSKEDDGPWKEDGLTLKPCWEKPVLEEAEQSRGYVTFSLTDGPEYHVSQISNAVVVARYLHATLVIPDIRGRKPGDKRDFEDVYDIEKFIASLDGVVKVIKALPPKVSARKLAVVKVPNRVTEEQISQNIVPVFETKKNIRLATYFPSLNMKKSEETTNTDSVACLAMFGTLEPQPEVHEVVDSMLDRLRTISHGQFVAVDLRIDMLQKKGCQKNGGSKSCYDAEEVAHFLRKIGFGKETTLYVTQTKWDSRLDALEKFYPKIYTKSSIMPMEKRDKFLNRRDYEEVIDFYICSESDVFVPAISGLFYANVAGKRIASGRTQILVPANIPDSSSASSEEFISHYVKKKNHFAYSCFC